MFRFDWDEDSQAVAELARDFGRTAQGQEREAAETGTVPAALRKSANDLGLLDLARSADLGGLGLPPLAVGHSVASLVAEAPTIGTALLLPEAASLFGQAQGTLFADGGEGHLGYRRPAGLRITGGRVEGKVALAAAGDGMLGCLAIAAGDGGDRLCLVGVDALRLAEARAMGLGALRKVRLEVAGDAEEIGPCGGAERTALFLYLAPFFHGYGRAALAYARDYAAQRKAFGRLIGSFQGIAFPLAEVAMENEAAELLWQEAAWRHAAGEEAFKAAALALRAAKDAAFLAANTCVGTLGGHGFVDDHPAERWLRDVETLSALTGNPRALGQAGIALETGKEAEGIA